MTLRDEELERQYRCLMAIVGFYADAFLVLAVVFGCAAAVAVVLVLR